MPAGAHGQIFLASLPNPDFAIGPLFVVANVHPEPGPVRVNLSFALTAPFGRRAADIRQDLYLLWPAEVAESTAPGPPDPEIAADLERRGFAVLGGGRLLLRGRDRMQIGTPALGDSLAESASYALFVRRGPAVSQQGAGTYVKIPWTPALADPLRVILLVLPLRGLVTPRPATWVEELFWGRRWVLTASFGDVGAPSLPVYPLYFEHRDRVVRLSREFSQVAATFADADHLRIEEIAPPAATRRPSRSRAGNEIVALVLAPSEAVAPQTLKVHFSYFSGFVAWRPIVVSALLLLLGNVAGLALFSKDVARVLRARRRRRLAHRAAGRRALLAGDGLDALVPGTTTAAQVVARCGPPDEERVRVVPPGPRALVYREPDGAGAVEVEILLDDDRVSQVERRIRRNDT
ncbi:MAG: hypothetical protein HYV94_10300 [Candidatus Rokubacteria bacterium]|nr:hypothetical protein [Candidatus Rokubacteria bacterium]MBI2492471.1 hypothetical protein [Candidatus Rokubacteria bacterium]